MGLFDGLRRFIAEVREEAETQRPRRHSEPMRMGETVVAVVRGPDGEVKLKREAKQARGHPVAPANTIEADLEGGP